ncbi:PTS transporter subunit EIIC [Nocardiopsis sp. HNM0947]|uniref:PTS transporter subunit EIIC n=1 Tax=Nocardiopsis coralli TaxID=2772213 RepID=A0ABR9P490_9ACTN|nr:PTS fructose transporter subunit IIBC [Nocardiopsis coralli]MBE2998632.1 PTS transporter subunit EIIC [Nocardiopsis coralli]
MRIVAVTSCPTGIAHTYMAAEALEQAGRAAGHEVSVETQGSAGTSALSDERIAEADAVVFAADVGVQGRERFEGKPCVEASVKQAVNDAAGLLEQAVAAAEQQEAEDGGGVHAEGEPGAAAEEGGAGDVGSGTGTVTAGDAGAAGSAAPGDGAPAPETKVTGTGGFGSNLKQWLMTGVSYVIPFVAAGGLLMALSYALGGYDITEAPPVTEHFDALSLTSWAALANQIGTLAMDFLVPVLAGFIAYAMADRAALAPGFVGGAAAVAVEAGFLGGLLAGLLAGGVVAGLRRIPVPRAVAGVMPVLVLPLIGSAVVGTLVFVVVGEPIAVAMQAITAWLNGMTGTNAILLGGLIGAMMAFDMGGPVNKVAYTFAVGGLTTGSETAFAIMAAAMAAGMTPPIALALATKIKRDLFSPAEHASARPAWLLGASFITEGVIPFAAVDPLRVIPSIVLGSATAGALAIGFGSTLMAPHGGVFVLPLVGGPLLYLVAILIGIAVSTAAVLLAKSIGRGERTPAEAPVTAAA